MPRVSKEWPSDLTKRLIREYEKRPEIWNPDHRHFSNNRPKQSESLSKLAKLVNKNVLEVKHKLRGLRTTYFKELTTQRLNQSYNVQWQYFNDLKFIEPSHTTKNKTDDIVKKRSNSACSNISNLGNGDETYSNQSLQIKRTNSDNEEDKELPCYDEKVITNLEVDDGSLYKTINVSTNEDCRREFVPETNNRYVAASPIDECQHFGNFIACEMRDMPLSKRRAFKNDVLRSILNQNT